jgi:hypothetical protein
MTHNVGGHSYPPPPPSRVRRTYSIWVVVAALLIGAGLGAVAVVATEDDEPDSVGESDISGILAELDEWEYVDEADTGVPLGDFCEALMDRSDVNQCFVVGDRAYFHEGP